jgi:thiamine-phosphate pyrophosphorylase
MRRRHPLPTVWLMTDERIPDLRAAVARLPHGAGIIFRHYSLTRHDRRVLFRQVRTMARRAGHVLLLADTPGLARHWGADGAHSRTPYRSQGLRTAAVHNGAELASAQRVGADLIFVSPVFPTRSHVGTRLLTTVRLGLLVGAARGKAVALGGMTTARFGSLAAMRLHGWAGIDAF